MTQQQTDRLDRLVEDYLGAVSYACADLDPQRRDELIEDLRVHIAAARAELHEQTEAAIRTILDRLGEPAAIAEEAGVGELPRRPVPAAADTSSPSRRSSSATLGMVLGFMLLVIIVLVVAAFLMMSQPPPSAP
jgi:uncharacterized membrane protein